MWFSNVTAAENISVLLLFILFFGIYFFSKSTIFIAGREWANPIVPAVHSG